MVERRTAETDISVELRIDGRGGGEIGTGIPFFDHMLTLLARHGLFDLTVRASGDIEVDYHHTVEDVGLCLGEALACALGDKAGIARYGTAHVPMMDAMATVVLDLSGRPNLVYDAPESVSTRSLRGGFDLSLVEEFLKALSNRAGIDLHVRLWYGRDLHHCVEAVFKALARALRAAASIDPGIEGVLSTKGKL
ncbi:MAG TPA: imidazoleglycerol-phosphate dehydratase HisB [Deltaproteobacteria bacterium]|nr:imidazoleglycerol-phosphate dehydratase HisB [Deltaproteobacteria bacterium]